ncbi:MAG: hypothetical protein JWP12_73 [Bacteroidetes bacterium]|nr:hypothetical protein [Bacteroidota bacterium]
MFRAILYLNPVFFLIFWYNLLIVIYLYRVEFRG